MIATATLIVQTNTQGWEKGEGAREKVKKRISEIAST